MIRSRMPSCPNCHATLTGRFCASCGERQRSPHDYSLWRFLEHALHELTHFDAKIFKSLWPLLAKPGFLTAEFAAGRRTAYIKPMTLFILLNVAFFATKSGIMNWHLDSYVSAVGPRAAAMVAARADARGETLAVYTARFDALAAQHQRSLFLVAIPFIALVLLACFRTRYYVEHLVYSIHTHAFYLFMLTVGIYVLLVPLAAFQLVGLGWVVRYLTRDPGIAYLFGGIFGLYNALALRRVYATGGLSATAVGILLATCELAFVRFVYMPAVFFWTFYST